MRLFLSSCFFKSKLREAERSINMLMN